MVDQPSRKLQTGGLGCGFQQGGNEWKAQAHGHNASDQTHNPKAKRKGLRRRHISESYVQALKLRLLFFFSFFLGFVALMVDWVSQPLWWFFVKTKVRKMILSKTHCVGPTISFPWSHWVLVVSLSWFAWPLFWGANMSGVNFQLWHTVFQDWQKVSKKSPLVSLRHPKLKQVCQSYRNGKKDWLVVFSVIK